MKTQAGFSLFELMMTVALAAMAIVFAGPMLGGTLAKARITAEVNALHHGIHLARQESIKRNRYVSLCKTADGLRCGHGRAWHDGWMIFANTDRDHPPQRDDGEPLLRLHRPADGVTINANRNAYTLRTVRRRSTNGTFVVCDRAARARPRALIVSYTGRPRTAAQDRAPAALRCDT